VSYLVVRSLKELTVRASMRLGMTQQEMADALGSSLRSISRWHAGDATPSTSQLHRLAALLHPRDPDLAHDAAFAGGATLEQLGTVAPPPPPPPPPPEPDPPPSPPPAPPPLPARLLVDAVVCAVAQAFEDLEGAPVSLQRARTAVGAAFLRAAELRLTIEEAAGVFAPTVEPEGERGAAKAAAGATARADDADEG
jgi:DNA-binding XRE family transcriptional regulator